MDSYVQMFTDDEIYSTKVTIKSYLNSAVNTIKKKLSTKQLGMFDKTCFGHFLNMHKLQFSGQVVNHMLWRQRVCDDPDIMVFNFGGSGARFTIHEFCLINGLFYGPVPSIRPTTSGRFRDTYFGSRKFPLHNHDIVEVFSIATYEDDDDMVKLALLYFLETDILDKEKLMLILVERVDMLDDIEYFLTRGLWDQVIATSMSSNTELDYEWDAKEENFRGYLYWTGYKPDVDPDADRVHSVPDKDKTGTKKNDAVKRGRRHSSPSAYTPSASARQSSPIASPIGAATPDAYHQHSSPAPHTSTEGNLEEDRSCTMKERLSSMDSRLSSIDSPYDCQSLRRKMIRTLLMSGSVTFDL
ncbi:hypothetical protein FNV43_RR10431 [Rhamnella rubrinervis]|uniref:DUF1985 domain-containing protein n=1 Tax=Rhamnella rubrinervis TaxID=2594499 RepID=A0A8K0HD66_9ROSA|nr:hypothetical protein FNV43_RR10431 [Rhamnella rubrinervis]